MMTPRLGLRGGLCVLAERFCVMYLPTDTDFA